MAQETTTPFRPIEFSPVIDENQPISVNIHISCESIDEILSHLSVIRSQLKKQANKMEGMAEWSVSDSNCYGTHYAQINW